MSVSKQRQQLEERAEDLHAVRLELQDTRTELNGTRSELRVKRAEAVESRSLAASLQQQIDHGTQQQQQPAPEPSLTANLHNEALAPISSQTLQSHSGESSTPADPHSSAPSGTQQSQV